jgi:hypothetical protein
MYDILWFMTYTWWNPSEQPPFMVIPKLVGGDWNHGWIMTFHSVGNEKSSQVTNSYFSE